MENADHTIEQLTNELRRARQRIGELEKGAQPEGTDFRRILASMTDLVFVVDTDSVFRHFFQGANREDLYLEPESFIGKRLTEVLPPEVAEQGQSAIEQIKASGRPQDFDYSLEINGRKKWFNAKLSACASETGQLTEIVAVMRDITERKQMEHDLQEALSKIQTLKGLIPICSRCKRMRDDEGYWQRVEDYIGRRSQAEFSHSVCPDCLTALYPEITDEEQ